MFGREAGHGGQLINNVEGPKDDVGGRYVQCPGPGASPSQALCWGLQAAWREERWQQNLGLLRHGTRPNHQLHVGPMSGSISTHCSLEVSEPVNCPPKCMLCVC